MADINNRVMTGASLTSLWDVIGERYGDAYKHWWKRRSSADGSGEWMYVSSENRSDYPDSGVSGEWEYEYLGVPFENARDGEVQFGTYEGTGAASADTPITLTFDRVPQAVCIYAKRTVTSAGEFKSFSAAVNFMVPQGADAFKQFTSQSSGFSINATAETMTRIWWEDEGKTLKFYSELDDTLTTYYYYAIF